MNAFSLFIKAFKERNFYILGAGASAKIIPFTSEQGEKIVQRHIEFGSFSVKETELDPIARRILGKASKHDDKMTQEIIRRLPSGAAKAISAQLMTLKKSDMHQEWSQYLAFKFTKPQSIIFNFNLDGLARHHCKEHLVLHPHGCLNSNLLQSNLWNDVIEYCLMFHKDPPLSDMALLPQEEYPEITNGQDFQKAFNLFRYTKNVVIIGYSFGLDGQRMDDWASFQFLKKIFSHYKTPIFIVDPYPEKLAYKLRDELKQKNIYEVTADWGILSKAIIELEKNKTYHSHAKNRKLFDIYYLYCKLQDDA